MLGRAMAMQGVRCAGAFRAQEESRNQGPHPHIGRPLRGSTGARTQGPVWQEQPHTRTHLRETGWFVLKGQRQVPPVYTLSRLGNHPQRPGTFSPFCTSLPDLPPRTPVLPAAAGAVRGWVTGDSGPGWPQSSSTRFHVAAGGKGTDPNTWSHGHT